MTTPDTMNSKITATETISHCPTSTSCKDQILSPMIRLGIIQKKKKNNPLSFEEEQLTKQLVRRKLKTSDDGKTLLCKTGGQKLNGKE